VKVRKVRNWITFAGVAVGAVGLWLGVRSFLPQRWKTNSWPQTEESPVPARLADQSAPTVFPEVSVSFLRCGSITLPESIAIRGAGFAPCVISHSAVLIRHPRATFLYDTGLCIDIYTYLTNQSFFFRKTLANFTFERSLKENLQQAGVGRNDLDFALLSHLHWDHVSGIPDIPGALLRINRVEYEAARLGLFEANHGLVRELMGDNPVEFFDCAGPTYEGFRSSYDLFGDGSVVLVPLPGHTAGNTGMFINRSNGPRLFLIGDAAWVSQNYLRPATMHPFIWSRVTSDDATARQTLIQLHHFAGQHPEIPIVAMHDAALQEAFIEGEQAQVANVKSAKAQE